MKKKIALITGASGFVGSNLACRLLSEGWSVHVIVRKESNLALLSPVNKKISMHYYSGRFEELSLAMESAKPDVVFHLASVFIAQHVSSDIDSIIESNIKFGLMLAEAMIANGIKKLVNVGTSWQNYNNEIYNPVCLYAASKQAFQDIIEYYVRAEGLKTVTLKLFDTYGPGDPRKKLIHLLDIHRKDGQGLSISPGEQLIDIVYIDDVVEAFLLSAELLCTGQIKEHDKYAVSSGNLVSLKELVKVFEEICGDNLNIIWGGRSYRKREVMCPWDNGILLPGWEPKVSLKEGLDRTLKSMR